MEITKKDAVYILDWLLDASFSSPSCLYTPYERELARKLIDYTDNEIGYPSIEKRIAQSIQPDKRWMPQGRTVDSQDYIEVK